MFGHGWQPGEGTVIADHTLKNYTDGYGDISGERDEFLIDVVTADGALRFRTTTKYTSGFGHAQPQPGQTYKVLIDAKHQKAKFDPKDPLLHRPNLKESKQIEKAAFDQVAAVTPDFSATPGGVPTDQQVLEAWRAMIKHQQKPVKRGETTPAEAKSWIAVNDGLKGNLTSLRRMKPDWEPPADEVAEADRVAAELFRTRRGFS